MIGDLQSVVGRNVRRYRREQGWSQNTFAVHIGMHRTYVAAVERGERNVTVGTVEKIANGLGVDPLILLYDADH
ncbi:helix-turn-helix domain-containing protein [Rhodococcoides fascians]|uniref:helix-turn-helix domain-containing protein n=1 Tax=Rhodococcoides fascians TaxID=1828 RepID=UPI000564D630|nr:helix-turn-helix transcriptional regulator [Rhodococcus fascians]